MAKKEGKLKNFFKSLINKIDRKMQEKANSSCCCQPKDKDKKCCS